MKIQILIAVVLLFIITSPDKLYSDITPQAYFTLGEALSHQGENLLPQDSSGNNRHFTNQQDGNLANLVGGGAHSGSTHHVHTPGFTGWWGADLSTVATDNFAVGVWARAVNNTADQNGDVFTTGGGANSNYFRLSLSESGWGATSQGNAWAVSSPFTANEWTHLMVLRREGIAQFFINGTSTGVSFNGVVEHFNAHLSVNPNFVSGAFAGDIDEVRVVTFDPNQSDSNVHEFVAYGIPEPSFSVLMFCGLLAVAAIRRR